MAWEGYNTQESVEELTKPTGGSFTAVSKPVTLATVERINTSMYAHINNVLRSKNIAVPVTSESDILELATINDFLTGELVESIKWRNAQNVGQSITGKQWGDLGRTHLKSFYEGKSQLSSDTSQPGYSTNLGNVYPDMEDEEPQCTIDYEW